MSNSVVRMIRDEYPAYDPVAFACEKADISMETFHAALDRVVCDGYYGPISDDDWKEQDGREPSNVEDALKILGKISAEIDDYKHEVFVNNHFDDADGITQTEEMLVTEWTVNASDIRREVFSEVVRIYGHLPW